MITKIVYRLISSKEKLLLASLLGLGGTSVYYGTLKPSYQSQVEKIIGSEALRDKGKEPFLDEEIYSAFYINSKQKELNKNIPSFDNYLKKEHLEKESKEKYKTLFSPEMREHIQANEKEQKFAWKTKGIRKSAMHLENYDYDAIMLDDRDITDKSVEHISELQKIQKSQFIQDIIWSLAEESEFNKTLIRPNSISITVELDPPEKYVSEYDSIETEKFPAPTTKINKLNISLKIFNPNKTYKSLFKQISLNPFSESVVNIKLEKGEIKLIAKNSSIFGLKSSSWAINPMHNHVFNVKINQTYPFETTFEEQIEALDLLFSNSKYISTAISSDTRPFLGKGVPSLPLVTYKDMQDATTSLLIKITPEQIKKDIEHWYGAYYIHWWRLRLLDIKNFFSILQKNIFLTNKGQQVSIIDKIFDDVAFRNNYYTHLHLNDDYRKILDLLFKKDNQLLKAKEIKALLNAWSYQIDKIIDKIEIKLKWEKEPTLSYGSMEDNSPFKTLSFKFTQEVSWKDDIVIPFKGTYDFKEKKFEENKSNDSSDKVSFDFSQKLNQIKVFLAPLKRTLINTTNIGGIDIFEKLIPNIESFIGWDKFEIKKNEKVTTIYSAVNSPIRPAADNKLDTYDQGTKGVNLGWKALDVEVTKNLSQFHNVFYTLYEKIDLHKEDSGVLKLTELSSIYEKFKEKPISMVAHIVNSTWDKKYGKGKRDDGEKRPWKTFFETLFKKPLVLNSTQFFAGYSHAYYNIKDWYIKMFENGNGSTNTKTNEKTYKSSNDLDRQIKEKNKHIGVEVPDFPAVAKTEKIKKIGDRMAFYYSSFYPRTPIVIGAGFKEDKYREFLAKEGSTTLGLINNEEKLKNILREKYTKYRGPRADTKEKYYYFPVGNDIAWDKVKISLVRLNIEEALGSVLGMDHTWKDIISSAALTAVNLKIYDLMGQAIQRDGFILNLNLMSDMGTFNAQDNPIKRIDYSPFSEIREYIEPNIDHEKFNLGSLRPKK